MVVGTVVVGVGAAGFAETFGPTAAATVWGPTLVGGVYGGTTGLLSGGPVEAVKQAASMAFPALGGTTVQFYDGWRRGMEKPDATWRHALWQGATDAAVGFFMGKAFELGSRMITSGALHLFGRDSVLFRPLVARTPSVAEQFGIAKMRQDVDDARSLIGTFRQRQVAYVQARTRLPTGTPELARMDDELRQLAASLSSSYHGKWLIKYQESPLIRSAFRSRVQTSYDDMMPELHSLLRARGYNVDDLTLVPLRNASSAGSTSMNLDLALQETRVRTIKTPTSSQQITEPVRVTRNGQDVSLAEFQQDAQLALNESYHKVTGFSALRSEVNLTTTAHGEAFSTPALLDHYVDFTRLSPDDLASVGRVVDVKALKIKDDPVLSPIARLQASCRETSQEIDNMLLKKLRQELTRTAPGSPASVKLERDLADWEDMGRRFKQIGREEVNPSQILEMQREIRLETVGKGAHEVIQDLSGYFKGTGV